MTAVPNPLKPVPPVAKTMGISPKAVWAVISPALGTFATAVVSSVLSGNVNKSEIIIAAVGCAASVLSGLGAFLAKPGNVVVGS